MDPEQEFSTYSGSSADDFSSVEDYKNKPDNILQNCYAKFNKAILDVHDLKEIKENLLDDNERLKLEIKSLENKLRMEKEARRAEIRQLKKDFDETVVQQRSWLEIKNKLLTKNDKLEKSENILKPMNIRLSSELAELTAKYAELQIKNQQSKKDVNYLKSAFQHQTEELELTLLQNQELIQRKDTEIVHLKALVEELYEHLNDRRQTIEDLQHKREQKLEDQILSNLKEQLSLSNTLEEDNLEENDIVSEWQDCPENPEELPINDDNNKQQLPTVPVSDIDQPLCNSSSIGNEEKFSDSGFVSHIHSSTFHENDQSSLLSDSTEQPGTSSQNITVQPSTSTSGDPGHSRVSRVSRDGHEHTDEVDSTAPQSKATFLEKRFLVLCAVVLFASIASTLSASIAFMLGVQTGASFLWDLPYNWLDFSDVLCPF